MVTADLLAEQPFFSAFSPDQLGDLAQHTRALSFDPHTLIFKERDPADTLYLVRFGRVALQLHAAGRGILSVQTLGEGEVLGISWTTQQQGWLFDARCLTLTRVLAIPSAVLEQAMEADHTLGYRLMRNLVGVVSDRLQATRLQLLDVYGTPTG